MIEPVFWSKLHGASTHFPIALMFASAFCDAVSFVGREATFRRSFRFAGAVTLVLGALGSYAAVATGLVVTRGQLWGHGALLQHHQFVWPSFALMTGLATWRILTRHTPSRRSEILYLILMVIAVGLVSGAGYWGGELSSQG